MVRHICAILMGGLLWVALATAGRAASPADAARHLEGMNWYTEQYPPYNFVGEDGKASGIVVDILIQVFSRLGADIPRSRLAVVPWSEAYEYILRKPGTALFSMTYTPEREKIMKFVGPLVPSRVSIMGPRASRIKINSEADLNALMIGVIKDDIGDQLIKKYALSDSSVLRTKTLDKLVRLVDRGRVDVVAYASTVFNYALAENQIDPEDYEDLLTLKEGHMGFAFHRATPAGVLSQMQRVVDELRDAGEISRIIKSYESVTAR